MSGLIPGVRNNGVILVGLASLPGSTQMLVVTAAGLIESQAIPSGASSWNDITGKPTEFPPSAHNQAASTITSGTLDDARLSANVARRDQANTFSSDLLVGTANERVQIGSSTNSTISAWSFALGAHYLLIGDSTGGGGPTIFRLGSGGSIDWQSTARADAGVTDVRILRNATGPTLETRAAGGLRVCNADGSALQAVQCSTVNVSGSVDVGTIYNDPIVAFSVASNRTWLFNMYTGAGVHRASLSSAGHLSVGTSLANSSQMVLVSSNGTAIRGLVVRAIASQTANLFEAQDSTGAVIASVGPSGNLTLSGWLDAAHRPFTFAGLPLASAAQNKTLVCTDSTLAMNGTNYGSTPSGGGSNRVKLFSNGTSWVLG